MNNNLIRESIDFYKIKLEEGLARALGRGVGRVRNAARAGVGNVKNAARAVGNIPGVKPVLRTAAVGAGVAGGIYAYNNFIKPDTAQINPGEASGSNRYLPKARTDSSVAEPTKKKNRGSYNTIVPVRKPQSSDYAKYAADVRSPGGAVGAERRRQADRVWAKWQAEDQAAGLPARPSYQDELKKSKENTARLEAQLRADDAAKNNVPTEEPKIYLGRKPGMLKSTEPASAAPAEAPKIYLGRKPGMLKRN